MIQKIYDIDEMLRVYRARPRGPMGRLVSLSGLSGPDGYNPSSPIRNGSAPIVYVRVERRERDADSWTVPFRMRGTGDWELADDLPPLQFEDPCVTVVNGEYVLGGVQITDRRGDVLDWRTVFLRGTSLHSLREFARSPLRMKDVRLVPYADGAIGVFTRPWGPPQRRAWIGYTEIGDIGDLSTDVMAKARLLATQPVLGQWWGVNGAYPLENGHVGVLAHIAKWQGNSRHYFPIAFEFDRAARRIVSTPVILAERSCFPPYPAKHPDLQDVIFPSWIDREAGLLYAGLSDSTIGVLEIDDPFAESGVAMAAE